MGEQEVGRRHQHCRGRGQAGEAPMLARTLLGLLGLGLGLGQKLGLGQEAARGVGLALMLASSHWVTTSGDNMFKKNSLKYSTLRK